ncbi:MAG: hypothetical protein KDD62_15880, partial [Bdellovibrionales bacterium]|nr:hypothetical protein [Bdellovibrionales bacterium]
MGKLAKIGIFGGKKVPVEGLEIAVPQPQYKTLNTFELASFESFGMRELAEKLLDGTVLDVSDIERLLTEAPFSSLLKLVELSSEEAFEPIVT